MGGVVTYEWRGLGVSFVNPRRVVASNDILVVVDISGEIIPLKLLSQTNAIQSLTSRERAIWEMQINTGYFLPVFAYNAASSSIHFITSNVPYDLKHISPMFHKIMTTTTPFGIDDGVGNEAVYVYARNRCWRFGFDGKCSSSPLIKANHEIRASLYTGTTSPILYHGQDNVIVMFQPETNVLYMQYSLYFMSSMKIPPAYRVVNISAHSCTSIAVLLCGTETGKYYFQYCSIMYSLGHCYVIDGLPEWCFEPTTKMFMVNLAVVFVSSVGIVRFNVGFHGTRHQPLF